MKPPKVNARKYIVDVCYGGCYALFPDGTVRQFRDEDDCRSAILEDQKPNKRAILVAVIQWNYRDREIHEQVKRNEVSVLPV